MKETINMYLVTTSIHKVNEMKRVGRLFKGRRPRAYIYIINDVDKKQLPKCRKIFGSTISLFKYLEKRSKFDYGEY